MAEVLSAKKVVCVMSDDLITRIDSLKKHGINPMLAVVRMGDRPEDLSYERSAAKRAENLGIVVKSVVLPESATTEELCEVVHDINSDDAIHGCLLMRPLSEGVDEQVVCNTLEPGKDIDGITQASLAGVFTGLEYGFAPSTAQACLEMLDGYNIAVQGKHVVVVGRSLVVGRPVAMMLMARNATVTICHSKTVDLSAVTRSADVVVCAMGRPRALDASYFKEGQVVLDVGINADEQGNLCGDVDYETVEPIVDAITPVPGGIGSLTTITTMAHVVSAAEALLPNK